MIKNTEPLSMAEAAEFTKKTEELDMPGFIKKFTKLNPKQAKELRKEIESLDLMKVNGKHTSKIIDLLPEDEETLNKIFTDVSLDEEETRKLLDAIKKHI
jgi:DNA-directed RNA polymerase subunit F